MTPTQEPCDCGKGEWCPQFGAAFAAAQPFQPGDVIRYRWHHPANSWMDRWGPGTVHAILPSGRLQIDLGPGHSPGLDVYWMFPQPDEVYRVGHGLVEGEIAGQAACLTCGVGVAYHERTNR